MEYRIADDKELWECCQQGNEMAYNEIFKRYFSCMLRISTRYVEDTMIAEEIVMDCFFKLWDKRERIIIKGNLENYIFGCVHNAILSHFRKKFPEMIDMEQVESKYDTDGSADSHVLYKEVKQIYYAALEKLTPRRKEVFLMRREKNLSYAEIAQIIKVSESAVKNSMSAALEGLRTNMKEYFSILIFFLSSLL